MWSCSEIYTPLCRARKHTRICILVCARLCRKHTSSLLLSSSPSRQLNTLTLLKQFLTLSTADWVKPWVLVACFNNKSGGFFSWTGMALWTRLSLGNWQTSLSKYRLHSVPSTCNQRGAFARWPRVHRGEGGVGSLGCPLGARSAAQPASQHDGMERTAFFRSPSAFMGQGNRVGRGYALCYMNWGWNLYSVDYRPCLLICKVSAITKLHYRLIGEINGADVDKEVDA